MNGLLASRKMQNELATGWTQAFFQYPETDGVPSQYGGIGLIKEIFETVRTFHGADSLYLTVTPNEKLRRVL